MKPGKKELEEEVEKRTETDGKTETECEERKKESE